MGDQQRSGSATLDFYSIFGIKSLVTKWNPDKNSSSKAHKQAKLRQIDQSLKASNEKNVDDRNEPTMPPPSMEFDDSFFSRPPILLKSLTKKNQTSNTNDPKPRRTTSHRSPTPLSPSNFGSRRSTSPPDSSRSKSTGRGIKSYTSPPSPTDSSSHGSQRGTAPSSRSKSTGRRSKSQTLPLSPTYLSSNGSKRSTSPPSVRGSRQSNDGMGKRSASETEIPTLLNPTPKTPTPILYSQSTTWRIPQAIEMKLDCTLEELCHGCIKKIAITRDVISNGIMKKEEEVLTINVKPGWRKGTRIRFEGKGSEKPGYVAADIVFLIDEIQHPLFTREGDDLEYGIEIPLMEALIGCSISVPLLGEETMWLTFSDVIYPGFQKVLPGQGMPLLNGNRRSRTRFLWRWTLPSKKRSLYHSSGDIISNNYKAPFRNSMSLDVAQPKMFGFVSSRCIAC